MTEIAGFKALVYNQAKVKDLARVTCPPYDVITPQRQEYFRSLDPHNLIHILLSQESPGEDKYQHAASLFQKWQEKEIFIQQPKPAIYFYGQDYLLKGQKKSRLGFIALLSLGEKSPAIYGHEHTRLAAKEDRLKLLRATQANLSPIFVIFADKKRLIQYLYQNRIDRARPFVDITDDDKVAHKLWRLDSEAVIEEIKAAMCAEDIFIADGHHRFEVACAYRDERQQATGLLPKEGFNYVLAYFTNIEPRSLSILAIHRLVKLDSGFSLEGLWEKLGLYFTVEPVKERSRFLFLLEKAGQAEHVIGMCKDKKYWLLRLKNIKILDRLISDKPLAYRQLDVCILNYLVLETSLGISPDDKERVVFEHDTERLLRLVDSDTLQAGFLLNPVKVQQVMALASGGNKMPAKTTYFYPKVLSGLVINKHEDV